MPDQAHEPAGSFWNRGELLLRVQGPDSDTASERLVRVDRPYALVGQAPEAEIQIGGPGVNRRHLYLHLDPRGVFAVDLLTRTGARFNGRDQAVGWLRPGDEIEVEGHRLELLQIQVDGRILDPPPCPDDPLARSPLAPLVPVRLEPLEGRADPWSVDSELIFVGWSSACGIPIKDATVAKVHCALLRTRDAAYLIDLCGQKTRLNDLPIQSVARLDDGDAVTIGTTPFRVHLTAAETVAAMVPAKGEPPPLVAHVITPELEPPDLPAPHNGAASDPHAALLAWLVESLQQTQGNVLQQQGEMQATLMAMLRQVQHDNSTLLKAHLERIERIDRELAALRGELAQTPSRSLPSFPPLPEVAPLRIEHPATEPVDHQESTAWLLDRISQLDGANRSAWKDLLGWIASPLPRRAP